MTILLILLVYILYLTCEYLYILEHGYYYPAALKGYLGIVFTHVVWMGGWVFGGKKFVRAVSQKP